MASKQKPGKVQQIVTMLSGAKPLPYPTDPDEARCVILSAFPALNISSIRHFGEGWVNTVWVINEDLRPTLFRFPKNEAAIPNVLMEMRLLPHLSKSLSTTVPDYIYPAPSGAARFPYPFGGYSLIPGCTLEDAQLGGSSSLAEDVGRFIAALQAFPTEQAAELGVRGGTAEEWRRSYDRWYRETRVALSRHLVTEEMEAVDRTISDFLLEDSHFTFQPVLAHRDLGPEHILVDPNLGRLLGVIDFEDAMIGDPAFDFTGIIQVLPGALQAFGGPTDATFIERIRFYRFLVPLHEIRYGFEWRKPEYVEQGLARLRDRGTDHHPRPSR